MAAVTTQRSKATTGSVDLLQTARLSGAAGRADRKARQRREPVRGLLVASDVVALLAPALVLSRHALTLAATALVTVLLYQQAGLYRSRLHLSFLDEVPTLLSRAAAAAGLGALVVVARGTGQPAGLVPTLAAGLFLVLLARLTAYTLLRAARRHGLTARRTLLVGGGQLAADLAATLRKHPEYGLFPVGYVDAGPAADAARPLRYLGSPGRLDRLVPAHDVSVLLVAFGRMRESDLVDLLRSPTTHRCEVLVVPRLFEVFGIPRHDHIGAVPVVHRRRTALAGPAWAVKRGFDVAVASLALLALSPLLLACAVAVRLEGGPGVLFRQARVGKGGQVFEVLKFRSLRPADKTESAELWSVAGDPRLGPVGRVLRRTSLDELPQLWNILRGEMTFVGPRPERPHFVHLFSRQVPRYRDRHRVPAGLTGLAQVSGLRGNTSIADRARYDNYYIENWSLWLDLKVILRTLREVVFARGA